ncbi:ThiF family adenylyltransferase [Leeuwenhoekiella sp. W20_SRS_FM14]|uniref:ThiF family adenylyltransferase n=1 Tax=Leeuwenhoekiella sp. W20_SRS_FM14 TaxID=3240270 RepID=UPI003F951740
MSRYQRQIILPQIGESGQQRLANARVLVIGAGGLGCALLPYLTASGIGTLGIVDGDRIEESNLHRQILYTPDAVGKFKVDATQDFLNKQQPDAQINSYPEYLKGSNAVSLFKNYDIIVDATDRIDVRYLINDAAVLTGKPFVYGSIHRFEGQVSVFNYKNGPTYRCLFPKATEVPSCAEAGVLGTSVGVIGMLQAQEVIKMILEIGDVLSGELLINNTLTASQQKFQFKKNETIVITHTFYQETHLKPKIKTESFNREMLKSGVFIDVREWNEQPRLDIQNLKEIPLSELEEQSDELDKTGTYYLFCQSGKRAQLAAELLKNLGFLNSCAIEEGAEDLKKIEQIVVSK